VGIAPKVSPLLEEQLSNDSLPHFPKAPAVSYTTACLDVVDDILRDSFSSRLPSLQEVAAFHKSQCFATLSSVPLHTFLLQLQHLHVVCLMRLVSILMQYDEIAALLHENYCVIALSGYEMIIVEKRGSVGLVTLNRPKASVTDSDPFVGSLWSTRSALFTMNSQISFSGTSAHFCDPCCRL